MRKPAFRRFRWYLLAGGAVSVLIGLLAGTWGTHRITSVFEEREANRVSRLLSRPYALAPGMSGNADDLTDRLDRLGYKRVRRETAGPGTYAVGGGGIEIATRGFRDASGDHPPVVVRATFDGSVIDTARPEGGALEPETIALFQGPHIEDREPIEIADCPKHLIEAILAAEDRHFFLHPGIDPVGIGRAIWADLTSRSLAQGGSTLTQQLAKNLYFSDERTFSRKASEAYAAVVLEASYSKERILRAYLNEIYLGQRGPASVIGVAAASRHYFGKRVSDISLAEAALIAGMIRAPGLYNPFMHPDRARERRDFVLKGMVETKAITEEQAAAATREPVRVQRPDRRTAGPATGHASYVADLARQELEGTYGSDLAGLGLRVYTSIDSVFQQAAEEAVAEGLKKVESQYRSLKRRGQGQTLQAALVAVDLRDGSLVALVGGRDFGSSQFNRATQAHRQPGSLFKPIVYLAGLTHPGDTRTQRASRSKSWEFVSTTTTDGAKTADDPPKKKKKHRFHWFWQKKDDEAQEEEKKPEEEKTTPEQVKPPETPPENGIAPPPEENPYEAPPETDEIPDFPAMPLTAATVLIDKPYEIESGGKMWSPRNDDDEYRGPVTVQRALEDSLNVPTARAAAAIGLDRVASVGHALGIRSALPEVPALALGAAEVTPMEMAQAFATIASAGQNRPLVLLRGVEDGNGVAGRSTTIPADYTAKAAVPPVMAAVMTGLLESVLDYGTGHSARDLGFRGVAAGKTGTSDGGRDLWFCGYTPQILALVWVGFDEPEDTGLTGSRAALPIWVEFMKRIGADGDRRFPSDRQVVWAQIDPTTGGLARPKCPETRYAPFAPGTEPTQECREHMSFWERLFN